MRAFFMPNENMAEETRAERNIRWIEEWCRVPEGANVGQSVHLREWQKEWIRGIYDQPTRRAIISMGRKNGKTSFVAFLLLLHLCGPEAKYYSQLYSAAQSRDQASILFSLAAKIVRQSPELGDPDDPVVRVRDTAKQLLCDDLGTSYRALSAEASTAYGLSPAFVVHDELGQVRGPRSELYEALETAAGAQEAPLSIIISTQAPTDADLLSRLIDDAKEEGDPRTRLFLHTADEDLEPFTQDAQAAANPALGDFLNADEVASQADAAKRMPEREASYRNLVLNQRVNTHNPFIAPAMWKDCEGELDEQAFIEGPTFLGIDLSARNDLTAMGAVAQGRDGFWNARAEFWTPEKGVEDRAHRDRFPYDLWVQEGYMTATPGASVDYAFVAYRLGQVCDEWNVVAVAFDRWHIESLQKEIDALGLDLPLVEFGQGYKSMSPALDYFEGELLNDRFRHDGNPALNMCTRNAVAVTDPAGWRKLDKSKATGRIDGLQAIAMAMGQAAKMSGGQRSIYESRGVISV